MNLKALESELEVSEIAVGEAGVTDFCARLRHAESEDRVGCLLPLVITVHSNLNGEPWGRKKRQ